MHYLSSVQQTGLVCLQGVESFYQGRGRVGQWGVWAVAIGVGHTLAVNAPFSEKLLSLPNTLLENACQWSRSQNLFKNISWTVPAAQIAASTALFYTLQNMASAHPLTKVFIFGIHVGVIDQVMNYKEFGDPTIVTTIPSLEQRVCEFFDITLPEERDGLTDEERLEKKNLSLLSKTDLTTHNKERLDEIRNKEASFGIKFLTNKFTDDNQIIPNLTRFAVTFIIQLAFYKHYGNNTSVLGWTAMGVAGCAVQIFMRKYSLPSAELGAE